MPKAISLPHGFVQDALALLGKRNFGGGWDPLADFYSGLDIRTDIPLRDIGLKR
jgi:hypothetical protein